MSKVFDMQTQLAIGKKGEELFLSFYKDLKPTDGRRGDFIGFTGRKIELKTESRTTQETPNFFIEVIRNNKGDKGGPYQALEHGAYYIVYLFACGTVYWFRVQELIDHLEANMAKYERRTIYNKGWKAEGILVPRASTEPVIIRKERLYERTSE